jgi:hypothetical protein
MKAFNQLSGSAGGAGSPSRPESQAKSHSESENAAGTQVRSESEPHLSIPARPSRLWLWFAAACVLQIVVWGTWITFASKHRVQEVPLATARPR